MRILISGIGRSATTLLYQQLAKCLYGKYQKIRFRYEPYLWAIDQPFVKHQPFDMSQISHFGVHVHRSTPLFLVDSAPEHDRFIDQLFHQDAVPSDNPNAYLAKTIRSAGRLESYLKRYPDLKIVACLRNPIDTINSSFGMFSFLGHEFHADDSCRLVDELLARGNACVDACKDLSQSTLLEHSIWWWRSMTEEILRVAAKFPENVWLFVNESFACDPISIFDELSKFLPFVNLEKFQLGLKSKAGPSIKQNYLSNSDIATLYPHLEFYISAILSDRFSDDSISELQTRLLNFVADSKYHTPLAGDELGRCTPTTLRSAVLQERHKPQNNLTTEQSSNGSSIDMPSLMKDWCDQNHWCRTIEQRFRPETLKSERTFGCVITCFNNASTIRDSLLSAIKQTRPFDEIVVVNDASTDNSLDKIADLVRNANNVKVLDLATNVGVSAARHFGIVELGTDFVTHMDGDDCFWPSKNFHEAEIVTDDEMAIAFSDFLIVDNEKQLPIHTISYGGSGDEITKQFLIRREGVPRDMTFARKLYFEVGGYDLRLSLYEDLEFKLRLSMLPGTKWKRSNGPLGTIYNRKNPTLSRDEGFRLSRALTSHFFRHVDKTDLLGIQAAEAYSELLRSYPSEWTQRIFERLQISSAQGISKMAETLLNPRIEVLDDDEFVRTIGALCDSDSFDVVITPWYRRYGVADNEGPHPGFSHDELFWQTSRSCGFTIRSGANATGIRGKLYLPHLQKQKLNIVVEQKNNVVQKSFDLQGQILDDFGNHMLHEIEIPMSLTPGETRISCVAASHVKEKEFDRDLYCLFTDWQFYC